MSRRVFVSDGSFLFDFECLFFRRHSTAIIMAVVYGYETARRDDPIIDVVDRAVNLAVASIRPEVAAFLGFFPFCRSSLMFAVSRRS
jgi:hypothetical protein